MVELETIVFGPLALERFAVEERVCASAVPLATSPSAAVTVARVPGVAHHAAVGGVGNAALAVLQALTECAIVHCAVSHGMNTPTVLQATGKFAFVNDAIGPHQLADTMQLAVGELARICGAARVRERAVAGKRDGGLRHDRESTTNRRSPKSGLLEGSTLAARRLLPDVCRRTLVKQANIGNI